MAALSPMLVSVMTQLCGACRPVRKRGSSDAYPCLRTTVPIFRQDLDRHSTVQSRITGLVDLAHATRAEGREDLVRTEACVSRERHNCSVSSDQFTASRGLS